MSDAMILSRHRSEDCLSVLSGDYDHCPELDGFYDYDYEPPLHEDVPSNGNQVDIELASVGRNFEIINSDTLELNDANDNRAAGSRPSGKGRRSSKRRGSETVRELSAMFISHFNRRFYSVRFLDWWSVKSPISSKSPIWLLGRQYIFSTSSADLSYANLLGKKEFMLDFNSRFWFTYRRNFSLLPCPPPSGGCGPVASKSCTPRGRGVGALPNSDDDEEQVPEDKRTSDCGWGCMLRCGQMILAQAMCLHFLSRNWTIVSECQRDRAFQQQIIRWFGDTPHPTSPFSIHQLVGLSRHQPGQWFGPHSICCAIKKAFAESTQFEPKLQSLGIYFAPDRIIYIEEIKNMMMGRSDLDKPKETRADDPGRRRKGVVILVPVQLGSGPHVSNHYNKVLANWLRDPCCLGIIGGRPRHSIYLVGYQQKNAIYLDPHTLQDVVNVSSNSFSTQTYHSQQPLLVNFNDLDPSCAVGFYCGDIGQLTALLGRLQDDSTVHFHKIAPGGTRNGSQFVSRPMIEVLPGLPPPPLFWLPPSSRSIEISESIATLSSLEIV